jgi:hypothetical protein
MGSRAQSCTARRRGQTFVESEVKRIIAEEGLLHPQ